MSRLDHELSWAEEGFCGVAGSFHDGVRRCGYDGQLKRIVVVEEDPSIREITKDILQRYGYDVVTSGRGSGIFALCSPAGTAPFLALIDAALLDQGDAGMLQKIYLVNPTLRVIITSIYNHDWDAAQMFAAGAAGFLKKPYRMAELLRIVTRAEFVQ